MAVAGKAPNEAVPAPSSPLRKIEALERLVTLRDRGVLSPGEFEHERLEILRRGGDPSATHSLNRDVPDGKTAAAESDPKPAANQLTASPEAPGAIVTERTPIAHSSTTAIATQSLSSARALKTRNVRVDADSRSTTWLFLGVFLSMLALMMFILSQSSTRPRQPIGVAERASGGDAHAATAASDIGPSTPAAKEFTSVPTPAGRLKLGDTWEKALRLKAISRGIQIGGMDDSATTRSITIKFKSGVYQLHFVRAADATDEEYRLTRIMEGRDLSPPVSQSKPVQVLPFVEQRKGGPSVGDTWDEALPKLNALGPREELIRLDEDTFIEVRDGGRQFTFKRPAEPDGGPYRITSIR